MSKLLAVGVAGSGVAAAAVGGTYLMKQGSGTGVGENKSVPTSTVGTSTTMQEHKVTEDASKSLEFDDVSSFKSNMKKSNCVKDYFNESIEDNATTEMGNQAPADGTFFSTTSPTTDPYKSCITINWKTTKYGSDEKGSGKFTGLGTFIRGDEGFITFNVAETSDSEDGKLKFTGIFYLVGKKTGETNKGETKYKKEMASDKEADKNSLDTYFPKASDTLKTFVGGEYGGFFENADKLEKACKKDGCGDSGTENVPVKKELSGANSTSGGTSITDWSKNFDQWNSLYQLTNWSWKDKINGFSGTGSTNP